MGKLNERWCFLFGFYVFYFFKKKLERCLVCERVEDKVVKGSEVFGCFFVDVYIVLLG